MVTPQLGGCMSSRIAKKLFPTPPFLSMHKHPPPHKCILAIGLPTPQQQALIHHDNTSTQYQPILPPILPTSIFIKTPHQWQVEVGASILRSNHDNHKHNQLLICKTGEGKSRVYLVSGTCIGGVTLCISPLLSLAMDQSCKALNHVPNTCTISSFHLHEMAPSLIDKLQTSPRRLSPEVTTFTFTSPQCFRNCQQFCNFLFQHKLIKFVVVHEIHLFAQFGNTFRSKFG